MTAGLSGSGRNSFQELAASDGFNLSGSANMNSQETQHFISTGKEGKRMVSLDAFSPDQTRQYAQKLFKLRVNGWGDETNALNECARVTSMTPLSFKRLMAGKTKDPSVGVFGRVRAAYLDFCARKVMELQNEIELERARFGDEPFDDLVAEAAALAAKIQAKREGR